MRRPKASLSTLRSTRINASSVKLQYLISAKASVKAHFNPSALYLGIFGNGGTKKGKSLQMDGP